MGDNSRPPATTLWPGVGGRQALINVGDNIAGPWSGVPPTPGMACLLPLVCPASYPWSVLPPISCLSCLLPLVWPVSYPWSGLPPTPGLACLLPLVWSASYPWSGCFLGEKCWDRKIHLPFVIRDYFLLFYTYSTICVIPL